MKRRNFVQKTTAFTEGDLSLYNLPFVFRNKQKVKDIIIGLVDFKYKVDMDWGGLNAEKVAEKNCHAIQWNSGNVYPIKLNRI